LAKLCYGRDVKITVGRATTEMSKLLVRVDAGEEVEIARDGRPVARLVPIEAEEGPGARFLAVHGVLAGKISISDDFELSESELEEMLEE
jgi:prevent-host-death family protein